MRSTSKVAKGSRRAKASAAPTRAPRRRAKQPSFRVDVLYDLRSLDDIELADGLLAWLARRVRGGRVVETGAGVGFGGRDVGFECSNAEVAAAFTSAVQRFVRVRRVSCSQVDPEDC